jgi:hypothetical protein
MKVEVALSEDGYGRLIYEDIKFTGRWKIVEDYQGQHLFLEIEYERPRLFRSPKTFRHFIKENYILITHDIQECDNNVT